MRHHLILRVVTKLLIPLIMLFALYVQFHGDFGPGGGFQAGVIFGSAFIVYTLVFGLENAEKVIPSGYLLAVLSAGLLLYTGVGYAAIYKGGNFLDYGVLAGDFIAGQHMGIILIELGVGITVAAAMIVIFFAFAGRGEGGDEAEEDDDFPSPETESSTSKSGEA